VAEEVGKAAARVRLGGVRPEEVTETFTRDGPSLRGEVVEEAADLTAGDSEDTVTLLHAGWTEQVDPELRRRGRSVFEQGMR
jgi:hypothetical protein